MISLLGCSWDIPLPRAAGIIYAACQKEGTEPRFVKLNPVFKCSSLKCGDRQSIPLTLEWSASSPHDLILAGCREGVIEFYEDFDGSFDKSLGLGIDLSAALLGPRSHRWSAYVADGKVKALNVEKAPSEFNVSGGDTILGQI